MTATNQPTVRILSPDQAQALAAVHRHVTVSLGARGLVNELATRVGQILQAKVALVGERAGRWAVLAESAPEPQLPITTAPGLRAFAAFVADRLPGVDVWHHDGHRWTLVTLSDDPAGHVLLLLDGDWTLSASALRAIARTFSYRSLSRAPASPADDGVGAEHRLAVALAGVSGLTDVCDLVLRYVVEVVPSRLAALAVPTAEGDLAIMATVGYPLALVEHLRIAAGDGVIGVVYQTGAPMVVADVSAQMGLQRPRHRYRTNSFIALPIIAGHDVVGVVCLTDRTGDGTFSSADVAALGIVLAPAALALQREQVHRNAKSIAHAAMVDPLSGLYNRRYFRERLDEELHRAARQGTAVGVLMLDIDRFKVINDTYGHPAGDAVVRSVAHVLRGSVRIFDVCARYGGDEFAVIMPESTVDTARAIAERIRKRVEASEQVFAAGLAPGRVTVSIGATISTTATTAQQIVVQADRALYAAKKAGSNRVIAPTDAQLN